LGRGQINEARYGAFPFLAVSRPLPDGQRLRVRFSTSLGSAPANETNAVVASVEETAATTATGRSTYDPATKTVSGAILCTLPSGKRLAISFEHVPVVLQ